MLRQVSNGQYLDAIRMAEKFILHVEVLFATIDDLEYHFARLNMKGSCAIITWTIKLTIVHRNVACPRSANALSENRGVVHVIVSHAGNWFPTNGHDARATGACDRSGTLP